MNLSMNTGDRRRQAEQVEDPAQLLGQESRDRVALLQVIAGSSIPSNGVEAIVLSLDVILARLS